MMKRAKSKIFMRLILTGLILLTSILQFTAVYATEHSNATNPSTVASNIAVSNMSSCNTPQTYTGSGANANAIQSTVDDFRDALGDLNAPEPVNQVDGRRQINWDAAPDTVSAPNAFPGDFFNFGTAPRARGIEFTTSGSELQLSATEESEEGIEFDNINSTYSSEFTFFSAERLFAPIDENTVDVTFSSPGDQTTRALVRGLGVVFTDVDLPDTTKLDYYDAEDKLVHTLYVPAVWGSETLSFAGAEFSTPCIGRVRITTGNIGLGENIEEVRSPTDNGYDLVAMDDFIFGEPIPITSCGLPMTYETTGAAPSDIESGVDAFRTALGDLNAPAPFNNVDGRRQIDWDAAPDFVSAPNSFPGDFFNFNAFPRARGIAFSTEGTDFQLSATAASGAGIEFDNINSNYSSEFQTFSPERLFTPIGSHVVRADFYNPADQDKAARTDGFGAIFTDVDLSGKTTIGYYDADGKLLFKQGVQPQPGSEGLSFAGAKFSTNCVSFVKLTNGTAALGATINDDPENDVALVVMDDFIFGEPLSDTVCGMPTIYTATGANATAIENTVDAYRNALGDLNPFEPQNFPDGHRQINWDAAPDTVSAPNSFPGDFFNFNASPRARGIEFSTDGEDLQLSATAASGEGIEFDNINNGYSTEFNTFSPERLFTAVGSNVVDARFVDPAKQIGQALSTGFGAVMTDVDLANVSSLHYYDLEDRLVWAQSIPAFNPDATSQGSLSFAGIKFDSACVSRVRLISGNTALADGVSDAPEQNVDLVTMDDFIYGEPQPGAVNINARLKVTRTVAKFNPKPKENAPAGVLTIKAEFTNIGDKTLKDLHFVVTALTRRNILLNANNEPGGVGSIRSVLASELGADSQWTAGESFNVDFVIGLRKLRRFSFFVNANGLVGDNGKAVESLGWQYHMKGDPETASLEEEDGDQSFYLPLITR